MITPTKIEEVMNGNIICPQMLYERGGCENTCTICINLHEIVYFKIFKNKGVIK